MKHLIVTADDFGVSMPVNEAVEEAHLNGILTAASLMVGAPAWADAVERARKLPKLGVGLHLALVDSRPVLPAAQVPGLVGMDGRFLNDPIRFGTRLFFSREVQDQAEAEIRAQFDRFKATGLVMDHINAHQHFHMHPSIIAIIVRLAPNYGSPPVRVPLEPFLPSYRAAADRPVQRAFNGLLHLAYTRGMRRQLAQSRLSHNDFVFGVTDSGAMTERRILQFLDQLPDGVTELYCHPATRRWDGVDNLPGDYLPVEEFQALVSPAVKQKLSALGVPSGSYRAMTRPI